VYIRKRPAGKWFGLLVVYSGLINLLNDYGCCFFVLLKGNTEWGNVKAIE
jgi:hypothetical protein